MDCITCHSLIPKFTAGKLDPATAEEILVHATGIAHAGGPELEGNGCELFEFLGENPSSVG